MRQIAIDYQQLDANYCIAVMSKPPGGQWGVRNRFPIGESAEAEQKYLAKAEEARQTWQRVHFHTTFKVVKRLHKNMLHQDYLKHFED